MAPLLLATPLFAMVCSKNSLRRTAGAAVDVRGGGGGGRWAGRLLSGGWRAAWPTRRRRRRRRSNRVRLAAGLPKHRTSAPPSPRTISVNAERRAVRRAQARVDRRSPHLSSLTSPPLPPPPVSPSPTPTRLLSLRPPPPRRRFVFTPRRPETRAAARQLTGYDVIGRWRRPPAAPSEHLTSKS